MDKLINTIKEMSKNPKGKAILFFGFYIVFFAILRYNMLKEIREKF